MHCKGSVLRGYLISVLYHHYEAVQVRISEGKKEIDSLIIVTSKSRSGRADKIFVKAMKSMNR